MKKQEFKKDTEKISYPKKGNGTSKQTKQRNYTALIIGVIVGLAILAALIF